MQIEAPASFTLAVIVGSDVCLFRSPMYHTCGDGSSPLCASVVKLMDPETERMTVNLIGFQFDA